eukprot:scaffold13263_cov76-Skeletonema_dohrnii-CCMP3373.AAC.2
MMLCVMCTSSVHVSLLINKEEAGYWSSIHKQSLSFVELLGLRHYAVPDTIFGTRSSSLGQIKRVIGRTLLLATHAAASYEAPKPKAPAQTSLVESRTRMKNYLGRQSTGDRKLGQGQG